MNLKETKKTTLTATKEEADLQEFNSAKNNLLNLIEKCKAEVRINSS